MSKKHSIKFWLSFWAISIIFLVSWFVLWQIKFRGYEAANIAVNFLPVNSRDKKDYSTLAHFAQYFFSHDDRQKTYLILFQNSMELRPGGGYIGTLGILKVKNGEIVSLETQDLGNFDSKIPNVLEPPYPLKEVFHANFWKLRDSNFSPDFPVNAKKAEEIYSLGQDQQNFDGVVAINSNVLESFLKVTGPIEIPGYPGTYDSENAILNLEYQVEQGFARQGIEKAERKSIMNSLSHEILNRIFSSNLFQKIKLGQTIITDLKNKDIQIYLEDPAMEQYARTAGWSGEVNSFWNDDYLMMVDANLGSLKSDYYIKRSFSYAVDLSKDKPEVKLAITYSHTANEKDWMTKDYVSYLRIYIPSAARFDDSLNSENNKFGEEFGKYYIGTLISVPIGQTKTFEFQYTLLSEFKEKPYNLLIQKQSGAGVVPGKITIINPDGSQTIKEIDLKTDWKLE